MSKRPISYTSRDFQSIKDSLTDYAKRYYPNTFKDFRITELALLSITRLSSTKAIISSS